MRRRDSREELRSVLRSDAFFYGFCIGATSVAVAALIVLFIKELMQ